MLNVHTSDYTIFIGERFTLELQRTLRVPDDGAKYPLPPGLGPLPVHAVDQFAGKVPPEWTARGGYFVPMYQREALWLLFGGESWKPNAVMVGVGDVNALTGEPMKPKLQTDPQNYLVCPDQLWLDGIHSNNGSVRQFVSMPLGLGDTVEEQLSGEDALGGIQLVVYEPKPGLFPDEPPVGWMDSTFEEEAAPSLGSSVQMGLGAGGSIRQKVYPDKYGMETWDNANCGAVVIHIANSKQYYKITGQPPPATPVSARTYTEAGLPWFDLYDETTDDIPASERFQQVVPLSQRQEQRGERDRDIDSSLEIARGQVHKLRRKKE